jgi:hypothetical protein
MAETLAVKTPLAGWQRLGSFETCRAEALFASTLQPSQSPSCEQVRTVVATTVRVLGVGGCAARTAAEFGDHPDVAVTRMRWALATVRAVYPRVSAAQAASTRLLAVAS